MKKWKILKAVTLLLLFVFLIYIISIAIGCYINKEIYPYVGIGNIMINNWVDRFAMELVFNLYVLGIPCIVDVILLVISITKIKKLETKYNDK